MLRFFEEISALSLSLTHSLPSFSSLSLSWGANSARNKVAEQPVGTSVELEIESKKVKATTTMTILKKVL